MNNTHLPEISQEKLKLIKQISKASQYFNGYVLYTDLCDSAIEIIYELCKLYKEKK
jgi:hypothetical protein